MSPANGAAILSCDGSDRLCASENSIHRGTFANLEVIVGGRVLDQFRCRIPIPKHAILRSDSHPSPGGRARSMIESAILRQAKDVETGNVPIDRRTKAS